MASGWGAPRRGAPAVPLAPLGVVDGDIIHISIVPLGIRVDVLSDQIEKLGPSIVGGLGGDCAGDGDANARRPAEFPVALDGKGAVID